MKSRRGQGGAWLELDAGPLALHHSGVRGFATGPNVRFSIGMPLGEKAAAELWASGTLQSMPRGQLGDEGTAGGGIGARDLAALAAGEGNYTIPGKAACEYAHSQFIDAGNFLKGGKDWAACLRLAERLDPSYKD